MFRRSFPRTIGPSSLAPAGAGRETGTMVVKHAILVVLAAGPRHGYAVRNALHARLALLRPVNHGQVYATLARLERAGLVVAERDKPERDAADPAPETEPDGPRRYRLLPAGLRAWRAWLRRPAGAFDTRSELATRIALLCAASDGPRLRALLARQSERCEALAAALRSFTLPDTDDPHGRRVRSAAADLLEAERAWLDDVRAMLPATETAGDA